jgi:hypothetical protein
MASVRSQEIARDMIVAWLSHAELKVGEDSGHTIAMVFKTVVKAVEEVDKEQRKP